MPTGWADEGRSGGGAGQGRQGRHRRLNPDLTFTAPEGGTLTLKGRALMLVRNVGHLMTTPAVLDREGNEVFEGLLDAMVTTLCAMHDLQKPQGPRNSLHRARSMWSSPRCTARGGGLRRRDLRPGRGCAGPAAQHRQAGHHGRGAAHQRQSQGMHPRRAPPGGLHQYRLSSTAPATRSTPHGSRADGAQGRDEGAAWIKAYEDRNVDIGLACGLKGRAQIGKGMWAMPDLMADDAGAEDRPSAGRGQLRLGAQPTAATLHATHYHRSMCGRQDEIAAGGPRATLGQLLTIPLAEGRNWDAEELAARDREQRAGHPGLCRALGRSGRGLFQGARHQ
jgi:malate synthase